MLSQHFLHHRALCFHQLEQELAERPQRAMPRHRCSGDQPFAFQLALLHCFTLSFRLPDCRAGAQQRDAKVLVHHTQLSETADQPQYLLGAQRPQTQMFPYRFLRLGLMLSSKGHQMRDKGGMGRSGETCFPSHSLYTQQLLDWS